jgi:hypothetical protein
VCDNPNRKGTASIKGTFNGSEALTTTYDFQGTRRGQPINEHHEVTGKFLGSDCGSVKPVMDPSKK